MLQICQRRFESHTKMMEVQLDRLSEGSVLRPRLLEHL